MSGINDSLKGETRGAEEEEVWMKLLLVLGFSLIFARLMRMKSFKLIINFYEKLTGEDDKTVRECERCRGIKCK